MRNGKTQKATPNGPKRDGGAYTRGIHHTATKNKNPNPTPGWNWMDGWMEWIAYKGLDKWQEIWKRKRKRKGAEKKVTIFALHEQQQQLQSIHHHHPPLSLLSPLIIEFFSSPFSLISLCSRGAALPCFDLAVASSAFPRRFLDF